VGCSFQAPEGSPPLDKDPQSAALPQFRQLTAGEYHSCGLDDTGFAWCWGQGLYGQLGDGSTNDTSIPVRVDTNTKFATISAGSMHTCALDSSGAVWCWGGNFVGRLGTGDRDVATTPVQVLGIDEPLRSVHAGLAHTCAVTRADALWCWGANNEQQLKNNVTGDLLLPVELSKGPIKDASLHAGRTCLLAETVRCQGGDLRAYVLTGEISYGFWGFEGLPPGITQLAQTRSGYCGLLDESVWCWGASIGFAGQAPSGAITGKMGSWLAPVARNGVEGVMLAASNDTMCVLDASGSVRCSGPLASPERTITSMQEFVPVAFPEKIFSITGGPAHLCALASSGRAWCWGGNGHGQLGTGTLNDTLSPTTSVG
jgi:hypothetical protein